MAAASWIWPRQDWGEQGSEIYASVRWCFSYPQAIESIPLSKHFTGERKLNTDLKVAKQTFSPLLRVRWRSQIMSPYLIQQTVSRGKPNWVHLLSLLKSIQQRNEKVCSGVKSACRYMNSADSKSKKQKRDNTTLTRWTGSFSNRVNWSVKSLHVQTQSWGKYGCFQWNAVFF